MIVGQPINRRDGHLKVAGRAKYAAEFDIAGLVYAVIVQSTIPAGEVVGFDLSEARNVPGVLEIITPENALRLKQAGPEQAAPVIGIPLLQQTRVFYNGQHIAVVVADTLQRARHAAELVRVQYKEDEAQIEMTDAVGEAYPPKRFRNGQRPPDSRRGDPEAAFAAAPVQIDATYTTPFEHHNPMELHATIALWEGEGGNARLTVYNTTQAISGTQNSLAYLFELQPQQVRAICPFVGGGFGCKGNTWPHVALTAMAARMVGHPVKLVIDRAQMYTSNGYRPRTIQRLRLGADREGRLAALMHDGITSMSPQDIGEFAEPVGLQSEMLYAVPNAAVTHRLVALNMPLPTYMRAPGEASGSFALESAMDELAYAAGRDPLELRLLNYAETDPHMDKPFSSKALRQCYLAGAETFGWGRRSPRPGSMRDGDTLIGWGMATATYPTNRSQAAARIIFDTDGQVTIESGTQDLGTGTYTVMAQVAADALRLPVHRIRFDLGDSVFPKAPVSGGSQTAASVGSAVLAVIDAARQKLFSLALADPGGAFAGKTAADLELENGVVRLRSQPTARVSVPALLARQGMDRFVVAADAKPGEEKKDYSLHSFGAQFVEVRIDPDLREIRVGRYVGAFAAGRILNAKLARSQALGGITFGIGMALMEQTRIDPHLGRVTNPNVTDYVMPVNADVPDITTLFIEEQDRIVNPVGVKGLGELPIVGAAAAIANAVYHATGIRVRDLPITLEKILA